MHNPLREVRGLSRAVILVLALGGMVWAQSGKDAAAPEKPAATSEKPVTAPEPAAVKAAAGTVADDNDFVIGVEDVLSINVWHEPEMSRIVPVRPDGKIALPLIGEFEAAGSTPMQLKAKITKALVNLVTSPDVAVIVQEIHSQKFTVMGEVSRSGSFPLAKGMTVLEALAAAGGLKDFANTKKIYILRRGPDGTMKKIPFNYKAALKGDPKQNLELQTRDTVVVP